MKTLSKGIGALGLGVLGLCPALCQDHAVSARLQRTFGEHAQTVWGVAFSPDGQYLASGSADGTVRLRRARDGSPVRVLNGALLQTLSGHSGDVHGLAFSPDGRWLASSGDDKTVRLWSLDARAAPGH